MLRGRNNENILNEIENVSHRKTNLLFLPCNMAAVQNLYCSLMTLHFNEFGTDCTYHLLTESEVITGKSPTEALMY